MMTIEEFCNKHDACSEGREWALAHCVDMNDAWATLPDEWLIWTATRSGVLSTIELQTFALWCARQVEHLMTDQRSKDALDVVERFLNGQATREELEWSAARSAAWFAARYAAWSAAWFAESAARSAEYAARSAESAARYAADAEYAARSAEYAARSAESAAQAQWLRQNTKPNFS